MIKIKLGKKSGSIFRSKSDQFSAESSAKKAAAMQKRLILHSWESALSQGDSLVYPLILNGS